VVTLAGAGKATVRPTHLQPWVVLLLGLLAAAGAAVAVAFAAAPFQQPAAYVADITEATGAPLLRMIEERRSHVS
jgi:hypothetical protein